MVYATEAGWRDYEKTNELLRPHGYHAEPVRGSELGALEPALKSHLYGAWYHPNDCHLRPDMLMDSWHRQLIRQGVVIDENQPLKQFQIEKGRITAAVTDQRKILADHYVLATGVWSPSILKPLGIPMPIEPGTFYIEPGEEMRIPIEDLFENADGYSFSHKSPDGLDVRYDPEQGSLLIHASEDWDGEGTVEVTASDGQSTVTSGFSVVSEDGVPVFAMIALGASMVVFTLLIIVLWGIQRK